MQEQNSLSHSSFRRNRAILYGGVTVAVLFVLVAALFALMHLQQEMERKQLNVSQNLAHSLETNIEGAVDVIDLALQASADEINRQLLSGKPNQQDITRFLKLQQGRVLHLDLFRATNEFGDAIYGEGVPSPPASTADRDYFLRLRDDPKAGLVIAAPIIGKISQRWIWLMARRITKPDGSFGGVVYASIFIDEIEKMLAQVRMDDGDTMSLRHAGMGLIAHYPPADKIKLLPGDRRLATQFEEVLKATLVEGSYIGGESGLDAINQTRAYRRNAKYGFVVNVGVSQATALTEWHQQIRVVLGLVAAFVLATMAFTWLVLRSWRREEKDVAALEVSRQSLQQAQAIAKLGHFSFDLGTNRWSSCGILDGILGIDKGYLRDLQSWLKLVAEEFRPKMQADLTAAIEQQLPLDREYRIIRPSDGQERWIHSKARLEFSGRSNAIALQGTAQDITERRQVEAALKDSEQRYRTLVEWTPEPLLVYRDGRILFVNPAAVELFGAGSASELVGSLMLDRVHPDYRQAVVSRVRDLADHGLGSPLMAHKLLRLDGAVIDVEVQGTIISFGGAPARQVSMRDITERKQIEAALKESELRYRTLVEWMPEPIVVLGHARILYANPAGVKMFGARSASDVVDTLVLDWVHPDDHQILLQRRVTHPLDSPTIEQKIVRLDGTIINIEVQGTAISYDGEPARLVTMRDITQRKQIEAALIDSEQRYRTLVEWTPEAILIHRRDNIIYANPAAVKLFAAASAAELVGRTIISMLHRDSREVVLARLRSFAEGATTSPVIEQKIVRLDGTLFFAEVQATVIQYDGEPALYTSIHDVTERKAIEATLETARLKSESASQAKSRFLASASHDLRQPAHALGLFVARLAELPHDAPTGHLVECMDASVRAMQDMLDGLFDLSRLDSGQAQVSSGAFPIEGIFGQLRNSFASAASDKGLRLRIRPSKAWAESDPGLLHRILLNLVSNAVRYTQQGSILVACRPTQDGTQLRIEVRDSGVGIAAQHHEEIFQEFFQVDNPQRDRSKGLGVGLSIVDRACRLLNHPLAMRSAPGCGTCFTLTVPLAPPRAGGTYEVATELGAQVEFNGLRVLLIEDDALGRVGLASLLTSWGCRVTTAEGAQAACDLYRQDQAPDITISDFRLGGGINGIEALERLSAIAGRRIAACLISGDTDANVRQQAQSAGLTLLQKPVRPAKLRSLMRHLVTALSQNVHGM
jgi:PAS domain S-box-containing protein